MTAAARPNPALLYLQWATAWSAIMRGYFVLASVWWVVDADLSPLQLVLLGTALEVSVLIGEVPTGVVADTISRKWSIVISQVIMAIGMVLSGLTVSFVPLLASQVLWGLGWTFTSGADIAWITDELHVDGRAHEVDRLIATAAKWKLYGGVLGMTVFGLLGWWGGVDRAIVACGATFLVSAAFVAVTFPERGFTRNASDHVAASMTILRSGIALARRDHQILLVLAATMLFNSGAEAIDRLFARHLVDLGLPSEVDPIAWIVALTVVGSLAGVMALKWVESRISADGAPRRLYVGSVALAVLGTIVMAAAPEIYTGLAGTFITRGVAWSVIPVVATTWVNQRATSDVRATVQSFLGQAESVGEIGGGIALGSLAQAAGVPLAFSVSAACFTLAGILVFRSKAGRAGPVLV